MISFFVNVQTLSLNYKLEPTQNQHIQMSAVDSVSAAVSVSAAMSVCVSVVPPASGVRKPRNVVISYDKSGSMYEAANANGEGIANLFSKNDLGKHSVEIVARSLSDTDTLEIITYDNAVTTLLPRTFMNMKGKEAAITAIKSVQPFGGTALWDGLKTAMNAAKATEATHGDTCVIMITDGVPSSSPPSGEVAALKTLRTTTENMCRLHTIGLGYGINSALLSELASDGSYGGSFIFIPDGTMMITSWVNLLANEFSIMETKIPVITNGVHTATIGTIKYGQPYTFVLDRSQQVSVQSKTGALAVHFREVSSDAPEVVTANAVKALTDIVRIAKASFAGAKQILQKFVEANIHITSNVPIMQDILGQVAEGLTTEAARDKWGIHHLRSLLSAHMNKNCLNFKDPGPMDYTSTFIENLRDEIDVIANSIDPPSPSLNQTHEKITVDYASFTQTFNNSYGGCFGGHGQVLMDNGSYMFVKDLKKGDIVYGGAKILCVVVQRNCDTVNILNDLNITPWHPVNFHGKWLFPDYITASGKLKMDKVYNFVLDSVHTILVNGTIACTLAHGMTGPIIGHEFFGTQKVHDSLKKLPGYSDGLVLLAQENIVRNKEKEKDGLVTDYVVA